MVLPLIAAGLAALAPTAIEWIENAFSSDDDEDDDYDYEYTDEDEKEGNWWFW